MSRKSIVLHTTLFFLAGCATWWLYGGAAMPLEWDNQHCFFMAERAASGVAPHVSQFDPKHTLSTLMSAAGIVVGRAMGVNDVWSARIVSVMVTAATLSLVWLLTVRLSNRVLAGHVAALTMLSFTGFIHQGVMGVCSKVFMAPFLVLTFLCLVRDRPFWVGFWGATAFLNWQPVLIVPAVAGLIMLARTKRIRNVALLLGGFAVPNILYETYFLYKGALREQLLQSYWFPSHYMKGELDGFAESAFWLYRSWINGVGAFNPTGVMFLLAGVIFWAAALFRRRRTWDYLKQHPAWTAFIVSAHAVFAFTFYDHQAYVDLFFLMPFIAVTAGVSVATVAQYVRSSPAPAAQGVGRLRVGHPGVAYTVIAVTALIGLAALAIHGPYRSQFRYRLPLQDQWALGEEVGRLLKDGPSVYAVSCTHLLAFNHVDNFTMYGFFLRGLPEYLRDSNGGRPYRPVKNGHFPDIVIRSRSRKHNPDIDVWLTRKYTIQSLPFSKGQDVAVWRRRSRVTQD